ncbi:MAG: hypothetical protein HJJLKODD_02344 [Phycisphaerae bacterium]|nr:hypothetical protein [Phycisphaerae bacterium]
MLYAALTVWLLVVVYCAHGVYQLWSGLIQSKVINILLLPGTLVAQLGHILGLLITGGTVNNTSLMKDEKTAEPTTDKNPETQVPVFGPIIIALLPILACGLSIYAVVSTIGQDVLTATLTNQVSGSSSTGQLTTALPTSLSAFWATLRGCLTMVERFSGAILSSDFGHWQSWLFAYLLICLTVRMAPLPGNQRGSVGAILLLGFITAIVGLATNATVDTIRNIWNLLSFAVATLLFLLVISLIIRGAVGLLRIVTSKA